MPQGYEISFSPGDVIELEWSPDNEVVGLVLKPEGFERLKQQATSDEAAEFPPPEEFSEWLESLVSEAMNEGIPITVIIPALYAIGYKLESINEARRPKQQSADPFGSGNR